MAANQPIIRAGHIRALAWVLISAQVSVIGASVGAEQYRRWQLRRQITRLQRIVQQSHGRRIDLASSANPHLKVGSRVGPIPVQDVTGVDVDLRSQVRARQALLFVSSCAPCVAGLVTEYEKLWRQGLGVSLIARIPPERIGEARREYGWRLPIYSDYGRPQAALACRVSYRPAVLVLNRSGLVLYGQGPNDDRETAISQVRRCLRGEGYGH